MTRPAPGDPGPIRIPFNKPYLSGKELEYIAQAVASGKISGDGLFTARCHRFFEQRYGYRKALLTTSATDALELSALLLGIAPGDEVIVPSYTFTSTANAFVLRGARIIFADSEEATPNLDVSALPSLITPRTRAVVPVHYAGVSCDMDPLMELVRGRGLHVVEDAAQAVESFYKGRPLGSIGDLAALSFHETKNVMAGEGGLLAVNNATFVARAEILREKGTNRSAFFRGEVEQYGWLDVGSSFLPSELVAAFLYAQLESLERIQARRTALWRLYRERLGVVERKGCLRLPVVPPYATNNAHLFYVLCSGLEERTALIEHLRALGIMAIFHYLPLHRSRFGAAYHEGRSLPQADRYGDCLLRLPLYYELREEDVERAADGILAFYGIRDG